MKVTIKRAIRGFNLIELMISISLSLLLLAGILSAYASSFVSNKHMRERVSLQQDARIALTSLSKDIRMAGSFGCALPNDGRIQVIDNTTGSSVWKKFIKNSIGISQQSPLDSSWLGSTSFVPEGDALIIQYGEGLIDAKRTINTNTIDATLSTDRPQINSGSSTLALSSCNNLYLFDNSGGSFNGNSFSISPAGVPALANNESGGWQLMRLATVAYSVGTFNGRKGLYLFELDEDGNWSGPKELASADKDKFGKYLDMSLTVQFGVQKCSAGSLDDAGTSFYAASSISANDWKKVSLVRIALDIPRKGIDAATGKDEATIARTYNKTIAIRRGDICIRHS